MQSNKNKIKNIASWLAKDNITKAYYFELIVTTYNGTFWSRYHR